MECRRLARVMVRMNGWRFRYCGAIFLRYTDLWTSRLSNTHCSQYSRSTNTFHGACHHHCAVDYVL